MSIKEKLLGLNREAEQKVVEGQRQREATEAQQRAEELRQENLKKARFERGRHILESKGIPAVMGEVLEVLKQKDPQVELNIREGHSWAKMEKVETAGVFVEKHRGEGGTSIQIGVQLNSYNLTSLYVDAAESWALAEEDILSINDRGLIPKIEAKLAELIFGEKYKHYIPISRDNYEDFGGG